MTVECGEITNDVIYEHERGTLGEEGARAIALHLEGCPACRTRRDDVARLARRLRAADRPAMVPPAVDAELARRIRAARAERDAGDRPARAPGPRTWFPALALAATLLVAVTVGLVALGVVPGFPGAGRAPEQFETAARPPAAPMPEEGTTGAPATPPGNEDLVFPPEASSPSPESAGVPLAPLRDPFHQGGPLPEAAVEPVPIEEIEPPPAPEPQPSPAVAQRATGDVSGDGSVDERDALLLARLVLRGGGAEGADANGDGRIDVVDLLLVSRTLVTTRGGRP